MLNFAAQILISLLIASVIGFVCAWLLRREAVLVARAECQDARLRLEQLTVELHAFRQQARQGSTASLRLDECETELRILESELESILKTLTETRQDMSA
ncbi:MAG: hypothetical protein ABL877_09515 [Thiobacillus sp.]